MQSPALDSEQAAQERSFLHALRKKTPRTITVEERRQVAEIASRKPSIDLEIPFEYNSAIIGPQAVAPLLTIGRALGNPEFSGVTFLIAGHTDAKGNDSYNQDLSERRAAAVKHYLVEHFKLSPDHFSPSVSERVSSRTWPIRLRQRTGACRW